MSEGVDKGILQRIAMTKSFIIVAVPSVLSIYKIESLKKGIADIQSSIDLINWRTCFEVDESLDIVIIAFANGEINAYSIMTGRQYFGFY